MNDTIAQQKQQLQELLGTAQNVGIVLSSDQAMDKVAAALSIGLILQDSGKNSQIVSLKEPIVEYSSLVGIDQIRSSFTGSTSTLTVSFPYKDGEIEKVSYNIEGDRLNVNLFAETNGITFTEKDIRYLRQGAAPNVIITIGVSDLAELGGLVDPATTKIINIDNNASNALYGDVVLVDAAFSSLSEMVIKIAENLQFQVEFDVAQNLLDGIMSATQNFTSPKTSPAAFEMAGVLMQKGAIRRPQKPESRPTDTSLQMLGNKPFDSAQGKPFDSAQGKPFDQSSFGNTPFDQSQGKQDKPFQNPSLGNSSFQNASFGDTQDKQDKQNKQFGNQKGGQKPFDSAQGKPFDQSQNKPFNQPQQPKSFQNSSFDSAQDKQNKPFGGQNFPKQNPFKKQNFAPQNQPSQGFNQPQPQQPKSFPQDPYRQDIFEDQASSDFSQEPNQSFAQPTQSFSQPQQSQNSQPLTDRDSLDGIKSELQDMQQAPQMSQMPEMSQEKEDAPQIPTEDQAPSDWFTPKVFRSNRN